MSKSKIVKVVQIELTEEKLQEVIDLLNKHSIDGIIERPLTLQEVLANQDLLDYLIDEDAVRYGLHDMLEYYRTDGWSDFRDYR